MSKTFTPVEPGWILAVEMHPDEWLVMPMIGWHETPSGKLHPVPSYETFGEGKSLSDLAVPSQYDRHVHRTLYLPHLFRLAQVNPLRVTSEELNTSLYRLGNSSPFTFKAAHLV